MDKIETPLIAEIFVNASIEKYGTYGQTLSILQNGTTCRRNGIHQKQKMI